MKPRHHTLALFALATFLAAPFAEAGSDATFGGPNTAGGAVTLPSPTRDGFITFNTFTGTYTLGSVGRAFTVNGGITKNSAAGVASLTASPITLGGSQTWTNHSTAATLARSGVNNAGHTLTIDGSGGTSFDTTAAIIAGSGGLIKNGAGRLVLGSGGAVPAHSYSGTTTLNGGVTMFRASIWDQAISSSMTESLKPAGLLRSTALWEQIHQWRWRDVNF